MKMVSAVMTMAIFAVLGFAQTPKPPVKPPSPAEKPGAQPLKAGQLHTYHGIITDGQCAAKGSHAEVMKKASVNSAANCVKGCARRFGYVLYNPTNRTIHKLSDQELPRDFPNQRVRVKGRLDKATNTIVVSSIEPAGKGIGR
ncbi:MAG TPA: DUF5818 domain-containing protein [Candidatus Angelobacter sp.]|nr:DUF5818 domain-containing protein [Candidatus Angelobacter sp.]